jgi:transcriptional regulator with XRE-family HTH domain
MLFLNWFICNPIIIITLIYEIVNIKSRILDILFRLLELNKEKIMETVGSRIKQRRNELKLTQKQIYTETGISSGNLSDIENGKVLPSSSALINLSNILQCSIDWMLKGNSLITENGNDDIQENYLTLFNELTTEEQTDIVELMEFKVFKRQKDEMSSTLEHGEKGISIA